MSITVKTKRTGIVIFVMSVVTLTCFAVIFYFIGRHKTSCFVAETTETYNANTSSGQHNGRLPRNIEPVLYEVEIFPDIYGNDPDKFTFSGYVKLKFKCLMTTDSITMNINKMTIHNDSLTIGAIPNRTSKTNTIKVNYYKVDTKWQFLTIHLTGSLQEGTEYFVKMNFTGQLKTDFAGLYLSTFQQRTANKYVAATQFSPTDARKAFPNLDEPDMKAEFEITLVRRNDMVSLSNMPKRMTIPRHGHFVADVYQRTPRMSSYLIAFVVGDLVSSEIQARPGLNFTAWAGWETINKTNNALTVGAKILTFFERYFGIEFPLPKQEILAVPETAVGAMENWGLIIFNENRIYYKAGEYSTNSLKHSVNTISHEIAHQWFGNLATMDWWSNLFLKEGFAMYFEDIGTAHVYPEWNIMDQYAVLKMHKVFIFDGLTSSHPVHMELYDTTQIRQVFDDVSYRKGGCMIRMLNFILGDEDFQGGLKTYLQKYKYGNADHNDLWSTLENRTTHQSNLWSVKDVMNTWVLQMNYPVVTIRQINPGRLRVTQARFLNDGLQNVTDTKSSPFGYVWKIPVTYTSSRNASFSHSFNDIIWMNGNEIEIVDFSLPDLNLNGNWLIANIRQWGYYRVNYDSSNWNNLINQLKMNHSVINVVNRAQIINDVFSLSKAKLVPLKLALRSLEYLPRETEYTPWVAAQREIQFLDTFMVHTELYKSFGTVIIKLISESLMHFQRNKGNLKMMELLTYVTLFSFACQYEMDNCMTTSRQAFDKWKTNETANPIDVDLRTVILCAAIKTGDAQDWEHVLQKYNKTYNVNEKVSYLNALSCTKDETLQNRLITLTSDTNTINGQDPVSAFVYLALNPSAVNKVWNYVTKNWQAFIDTYAGSLFLLDRLVHGITKPLITQEQLNNVEAFIKGTIDLGPAAQAFDQAKETIKSNIKWLNENKKTMELWVNT